MNIKKTSDISAADLAEINRLRSTHPTYDEYLGDWNFFVEAYEGGKSFAHNEDNLFKHPREHKDDYRERLKRSHYLNYCEPLVDFFTAFIFAETIQRNGGSSADFYNDFIRDVNKKGEDITSFMQQVSDDKQIYGMVYVLVDSPKTSGTLTKFQEKALGIRPYWVEIRPDEVLDWVVDDFEKYLYLKRKQCFDTYNAGVRKCIERYTEWSMDSIVITDVDVTEPNKPKLLAPTTAPNALGEVPIVMLRYKRGKINRFMGESFLKDLAANNREVMNLTSLIQEFLYRQCFNILAIETDMQMPLAQQQEGEIGTANTMEYPKGANAPQYIAPDSKPASFIQEERSRIVNEMYKRAAQDTVNELFNGVKSSGFSKSQSFSTTVPKIASRAETLEKAENRLMELTMKYMGKTWDGKVKYKDRYELTNITDALAQMTTLFKELQMPSETFVKHELKRMVHEFDGKIPVEDMNTIEAEIDAMDFEEWQDAQKLAFIGKAAMSPEVGTAFGNTAGLTGAGATPSVPGKTTAPKASTPTRAQGTMQEIKSESTKVTIKNKKG
jgi:hypothetical protein